MVMVVIFNSYTDKYFCFTKMFYIASPWFAMLYNTLCVQVMQIFFLYTDVVYILIEITHILLYTHFFYVVISGNLGSSVIFGLRLADLLLTALVDTYQHMNIHKPSENTKNYHRISPFADFEEKFIHSNM